MTEPYWELQPGSDVMATTLNGIGPVAITDENAGGVIGDIAYIVSGYVYNSDFLVLSGLSGLNIVPDVEVSSPGTYHLTTGQILYSSPAVNWGENHNTNNLVRAVHDVDVVVIESDGLLYCTTLTQGVEVVDAWPTVGYAWPYLERFNLKTKTWLSRRLLPPVTKPAIPFASVVEHSRNFIVQKMAGPFRFTNGGTLPAVTDPENPGQYGAAFRVLSEPNINMAGIANTYSEPDWSGVVNQPNFPPGDYWVMTNYANNGFGDLPPGKVESLQDPTALALAMGGVALDEYTFSTHPYASEGGFAGVINGKLYFGGGDGDNITGKEFFVYDPATEAFARLPDLGFAADRTPDYSPYGVAEGKLYILDDPGVAVAVVFDPAVGIWTFSEIAGSVPFGDQLHGVEIDGKLYFAYRFIWVFDPVALTVTRKAAAPSDIFNVWATWAINGKLLWAGYDGNGLPSTRLYDPASDTWTDPGFTAPQLDNSYAVAVARHDVPYLLSGLIQGSSTPVPGVYGLTGNLPAEPTSNQGDPMTTPDPKNHRNPLAVENRFTGLYPDNSYPLVAGHLDIEQEKRRQARVESDRTPRGVLSTNDADVYDTPNETYPVHPPFTEHGPATSH